MATLTRARGDHDAHATRRTTPSAGRAALVIVGTWVVVLAVVVAFGWLITHALRGAVLPWDNGLARWIADQRTGPLNEPADVGTLLGETVTGVSVAVVTALAFSIWKRSWRPAIFLAVAEAGIGGFYYVATHVDTRQRPPVKILDPGLVQDHSFPSGHVATAVVAYAGILVLAAAYASPAVRRWAGLLVLLPVFVLLSRLYQGAHHLTDVLTSLVYASVWLLVLARMLLPLGRSSD
jgi:undecaprenyl-diphosphatase